LYGIGKADNALRVLRYASQFVTLLAAHTAFVTAASVSFMPPHSFRPSFRYITPRSGLDHFPGRSLPRIDNCIALHWHYNSTFCVSCNFFYLFLLKMEKYFHYDVRRNWAAGNG
jgi:hypothetical protein